MNNNLPKEILIATHNEGKFKEIQYLLNQLNIKAVSAKNLNLEEPEENSGTFAGNSLIKAKFYAKASNLFALADDSGICIEDLDGIPGVDSAPFAYDKKSGKRDFQKAFQKIQNLLNKKNINPNSKPKAYFICNLCLYNPKTDFSINFEGRIDGHLIFPPKGNKGFGYDPIFVKEGMEESFGEIVSKKKDKISHRAEAFKKMISWL